MAFSNQGALPTIATPPNYSGIFNQFKGSNPLSTALNTTQKSGIIPTGTNSALGGVKNPPQSPAVGSTGGYNLATQAPQDIHKGLIDTVKTQGGTHTITGVDGATSSVKVNPQTNAGLMVNGVKTSGEPGTAGNNGPAPKPTLTPVTLPNGQSGFTNEQGEFVDANGNPTQASPINNQAPNTNSPTSYQGLLGSAEGAATGNLAIGKKASDIASEYGKKIADVGRQGANAQAGYETTGTTPVAEGNSGVIARNTAAQESALASGETAALQGTGQELTAQNQETTALTSLANLAPELLRYGGSANMTAAEATQYKANLASAGTIATQINDLSSKKDAADAGFTRLINAAGSLDANTPITVGLAQLTGNTVQDSAAVSAFQSQLAIARQQWADLGLGDATKALPDNITKNQLLQAQQTMQKQVASNLSNLNGTLDGIKNNPSGTTETKTNSSSSFTEGQKNSTGDLIYQGGKWVKA